MLPVELMFMGHVAEIAKGYHHILVMVVIHT